MYYKLIINSKGNTMLYPESAVKSSNEWPESINHDMGPLIR